MAGITWNDVTAFAPSLATLAVGAQADILAHVNAALNVDTWGGEASPTLRLARIYLAAHHGTVAQGGGTAGGPVVSEKVGSVSRTYAVVKATRENLMTTAWGQQYLALMRSLPAARLPQAF